MCLMVGWLGDSKWGEATGDTIPRSLAIGFSMSMRPNPDRWLLGDTRGTEKTLSY